MRGGAYPIAVSMLAVIGCSGSGEGTSTRVEKKPKMDQKITTPTREDLARIAEQEAAALRLLKSKFPGDDFHHDEADLSKLQLLVDAKALRPDQTYEWQCLGAVLGQVFASRTPLKWVIVEDEHGRDLALNYPETSILVFPLTIISKRIEDGRDVDVVPLYRTIAKQIETIKNDPEYER